MDMSFECLWDGPVSFGELAFAVMLAGALFGGAVILFRFSHTGLRAAAWMMVVLAVVACALQAMNVLREGVALRFGEGRSLGRSVSLGVAAALLAAPAIGTWSALRQRKITQRRTVG